MAKKRRPAKAKVPVSKDENGMKPLPAKRPRRGVSKASRDVTPPPAKSDDFVTNRDTSKTDENGMSRVDAVNDIKTEFLGNKAIVEENNVDQVSISEQFVTTEAAPTLVNVTEPNLDASSAVVTVESSLNVTDSAIVTTQAASASSDSSSDSDSSSSSDSDSSDSDSKSGTGCVSPNQHDKQALCPPVADSMPKKEKSSSSDSYHSDTEEEDKKRRKKQKNLQRQIVPKRPRRVALGRGSRSDALDDEEDEGNCDDVPDWSEEDFSELLRRMEDQLPTKDCLKFDSRAAKLDWGRIQFNDYTMDECYEVWVRISKRIRRFRTLNEMLLDAREWITKPWTNFYRGTKKNRHPDMPSRPLSTYMIYYLEQKDRVSTENPGMEMTQISKIISEQYKSLSDVDKDKYMDLAAKERHTFEEKLSDFYKDHPEMIPSPTRPSWRETNAKGPRKPNAPFKLFYQDQLKIYSENGMYDRKAIEDMSKEMWRAMSDKKKLVWITWSLEDLKRYEDELAKYQQEHPDYIPPVAAKNVLNKDERAIKERLAGKPVKPPNSAYSYFSRVMLQSDEEIKCIPPKLRMAEISRKWKEISDSQKTKYEETVRELQDQYKLEFASYLEGLSKEEREEEIKKSQPKRKCVTAKCEAEPPPAAAQTATPAAPARRQPSRAVRGARGARARLSPDATTPIESIHLYKGEPAPPLVRAYDLFLKKFLADRPSSTSEAQCLKEAPRYWEVLNEVKKERFRQNLAELKQKYIKDYEIFLKGLSPEELKEFSLLKAKSKRLEEQRENTTLSDSEESESGKDDSTSGSDTEGENGSRESKSTSSLSDA